LHNSGSIVNNQNSSMDDIGRGTSCRDDLAAQAWGRLTTVAQATIARWFTALASSPPSAGTDQCPQQTQNEHQADRI
jgi:hypothetical protein